jgi:HK97 family phage prohead protease
MAAGDDPQIIRGRIWSTGAELKALDVPAKRLVAGYASRPTLDRVHEVVDAKAFDKSVTIFNENPVMLYMHDPRRPIGKFTSLDVTPEGLFVTGELAEGTKDADEAWRLIQQGVLKAFSIGFREIDHQVEAKTEVRHITELELYEISVVSIPANREALFTMAAGKLLDVQVLDLPSPPVVEAVATRASSAVAVSTSPGEETTETPAVAEARAAIRAEIDAIKHDLAEKVDILSILSTRGAELADRVTDLEVAMHALIEREVKKVVAQVGLDLDSDGQAGDSREPGPTAGETTQT